jgi:hypothetical protein
MAVAQLRLPEGDLLKRRLAMISREAVLQTLQCTPSQYPQMLEERFPHVLEKIVQLWNSHEGEHYMADLLQPNGRGGGRFDRDGFPERAWQEIFLLKQLYHQPRPKLKK